MQTATRAAVQAGGALIRKMRSFEELHTFASHRSSNRTLLWGAQDYTPPIGGYSLISEMKGQVYENNR
jgi:hypothetical protein